MHLFKNIFSLYLAVAVISGGFGVFTLNNGDINSRTALKEAIVQVKHLARSADNPETFTKYIEKAVTSIHVAAGLKTVIKNHDDFQLKSRSIGMDNPCLVLYRLFSFQPDHYVSVDLPFNTFQSVTIKPPTPPPCFIRNKQQGKDGCRLYFTSILS